ncbi:MAG: diiron oxygenase [Myxococcales bacterium]|nr:diiron oxygenase [Myxococcales bacterium]
MPTTYEVPKLPTSPSASARLRNALRAALRDALMGAGGLSLFACGGDALPSAGFQPRSCETTAEGQVWNPLPGLNATPPADHWLFDTRSQVFSRGAACSGATTPAACQSTYEALLQQARANGCMPGGCPSIVMMTRGDEAKALTSLEELRPVIAPIDTADEAALLVGSAWFNIGCTVAAGGVRPLENGSFEVRAQSTRGDCEVDDVLLRVGKDGTVTELRREGPPRNNNCAVGRLPEGLRTPASPCGRTLGAFFAEIAELEAASIPAFMLLARDLEHLGAPEDLVHGARRAARDEVKHARDTQDLANKYGSAVREVVVDASAPKTRLALALDNAVEGCVRETFGALVAAYQATRAADPNVAALMQQIARDEASHAELAHELDAWLWPQLSPEERHQVHTARLTAIGACEEALQESHDEEVYVAAGYPRPEVALQLHKSLFAHLNAT